MVSVARKHSQELRDPKGPHRCALVIALTHCRLPNDIDLANDLGAVRDSPANEHGVDLVLGGHDHTYYVGRGIDEYTGADWRNEMPGQERDKACMVVKSGADFHDLSEITLELSEPDDQSIRQRRIVGAKGALATLFHVPVKGQSTDSQVYLYPRPQCVGMSLSHTILRFSSSSRTLTSS